MQTSRRQQALLALLTLCSTLSPIAQAQPALCYDDAGSLALDIFLATDGGTFTICPDATLDIADSDAFFIPHSNTWIVCDGLCNITSSVANKFIAIYSETETIRNTTFSGVRFTGFEVDNDVPYLIGDLGITSAYTDVGDVTFHACTFEDNFVLNQTHMLLIADVKIKNSTFSKNTVGSSESPIVTAGLGTIEVWDTYFYDNQGSTLIQSTVNGKLTIHDSCFQNNNVTTLAFVDSDSGSILVEEGGNFGKDNPALCNGVFESLTGCTVFDNEDCVANDPDDGVDDGLGGDDGITPGPACYTDKDLMFSIMLGLEESGLYTVCAGSIFEDTLLVSSSNVVIRCEEQLECTFMTGTESALIVYSDTDASTVASNVTISGMSILNYSGPDGAVLLEAESVHLEYCIFEKNVAQDEDGDGSILISWYTDLKITACGFYLNSATGAVIFSHGGDLNIDYGDFADNIATEGAMIYASNGTSASVSNSCFANNEAVGLNYIDAESGAVLVESVNNWADGNILTMFDCPGFSIGAAFTCEPFDGTSCAADSLEPGDDDDGLGGDDSLEPDTDAPTASPSASPSGAPQATSTTAAPVSSPIAGPSASPVSSAGFGNVGWKMSVLGTALFSAIVQFVIF